MVLFFPDNNILLLPSSPAVNFTVIIFFVGSEIKTTTKCNLQLSAEMEKKSSTNFEFWPKIWQKCQYFWGKSWYFPFVFFQSKSRGEKNRKIWSFLPIFLHGRQFYMLWPEKKNTPLPHPKASLFKCPLYFNPTNFTAEKFTRKNFLITHYS